MPLTYLLVYESNKKIPVFLTISFYINKFCLPLVILSAREEFFEDKVLLLLPYWQIAIFLFSGIGRFFPLYFFLISAYQCIIILLKKQEKLAREFARFAVFCQFSSRMTMPLSSPMVLCSRTWNLRSFYYLYLEENEKKKKKPNIFFSWMIVGIQLERTVVIYVLMALWTTRWP